MPGIRKYFVYHLQWLTNIVLALSAGIAITAIQVTVDSPQIRSSLTLLFLIITILIACSQLMFSLRVFKKVMGPIESLSSCIEEWVHLTEVNKIETITLEKIRHTMQSLQDLALDRQGAYPREVRQLQLAFGQTLQLMEAAWQKAEADAIMVGLGGVCAQVAHDIRGPVSAIKVLSRAILDVHTDSERKELSLVMGQSADKLSRMADELLSYRKATSVELKPADLSNIVRNICNEMSVLANGKNVRLTLEIPSEQEFMGDADKVGRVLQNLVSNAIQAVEKQGDGQVTVEMSKQTDNIMLNIRDNGPGFPEEHVGKMFKTGFTTKGNDGNGLGLIYCANVIKAHGGQIHAINHPEGGAQVAIMLPCEIAH